MKKLWSLLCIIGLFCSMSVIQANQTNITIQIPITQIFNMNDTQIIDYDFKETYEIKALDAQVPSAQVDGKDCSYVTMEGNNNTQLVSFTFDHVGVYQYELVHRSHNNDRIQYDTTKYLLSIYVKNGEGSLVSEVIVQDEHGVKCGQVAFVHDVIAKSESPTKPITPTPPTSDVTNRNRVVILSMISLFAIVALVILRKKHSI